jgi:hypothetical protein
MEVNCLKFLKGEEYFSDSELKKTAKTTNQTKFKGKNHNFKIKRQSVSI